MLLVAMVAHTTFYDMSCCLQATSASYLQAAVVFSHPVSEQLLAALTKPLQCKRSLAITPLSACLLALARLDRLQLLTWRTAFQYALEHEKADAPGESMQLSPLWCASTVFCLVTDMYTLPWYAKPQPHVEILSQRARSSRLPRTFTRPGCCWSVTTPASTSLCPRDGQTEPWRCVLSYSDPVPAPVICNRCLLMLLIYRSCSSGPRPHPLQSA